MLNVGERRAQVLSPDFKYNLIIMERLSEKIAEIRKKLAFIAKICIQYEFVVKYAFILKFHTLAQKDLESKITESNVG